MSNEERVDHPSHYNAGKFEVIDVIEDWGLGFNDGNALKYIGRHKHKGRAIEDLEKAAWYLAREIARLKSLAEPYDLSNLPCPYCMSRGSIEKAPGIGVHSCRQCGKSLTLTQDRALKGEGYGEGEET